MTSMSVVDSSSGAMLITATVSPICSGEVIFETVHLARNGRLNLPFGHGSHSIVVATQLLDKDLMIGFIESYRVRNVILAIWHFPRLTEKYMHLPVKFFLTFTCITFATRVWAQQAQISGINHRP